MAVEAQAGNLFGEAAPTPGSNPFLDQIARVEDAAKVFLTECSKLRALSATVAMTMEDPLTRPTKKPHTIKALLTKFDLAHQAKFHHPVTDEPIPANINGAKDATTMKRLLGQYSHEMLEELIDDFFSVPSDYAERVGYTVGVFSTAIAGLISRKSGPIRTHGMTPKTADNRRQSALAVQMIQQRHARSDAPF